MDDNRTIDRKSTNGGVRKVRCPRCKNLLIEPTDIPLYRCGICSTVLEAKHYKGPPVHARLNLTTSNSISSRSTASNESSEVNGLVEKSGSLFLGEQNFTGVCSVDTCTVEDEVPINDDGHSDSNFERSLEIGKTDDEEGTMGAVSNEQLQKSTVNDSVEKSQSVFTGEQNLTGARSIDTSTVKDEVPINGNGHSDTNSERSLEIGKSGGEEETTVVVSSEENSGGLEKSSPLPASDMEKPASSGKESPKIESPEGRPEADGSMQKSSLILEANEFESKYTHSSSGKNSLAGSQSIHPGVDISNNGSKINEQVVWTDSESMHPIGQQNLPISNTNDNSAKDELPQINYNLDFNCEQCLPAVSGCEDQENKKETVNLSELVDKSVDLEVDDAKGKGDLSASRGSSPTASMNLSPLDNIKEEADFNSKQCLPAVSGYEDQENKKETVNFSELVDKSLNLEVDVSKSKDDLSASRGSSPASMNLSPLDYIKEEAAFNSEQCLPAVSGCEDQENKKETVNLSELVDKSLDLEVDVSKSKGDLSASHGSSPTAPTNLSPPDNMKEEAVTQSVETIALKEIVSEPGSGPHSSSGQQCHEMKENHESQENATEHSSSSIHVVQSMGHGSSEMENARSSSVEDRCFAQSVETVAPKGIVSEPSCSHHSSFGQQCQDVKENCESEENVTEHTSSSIHVVKSIDHGSSEMENARSSSVEERRTLQSVETVAPKGIVSEPSSSHHSSSGQKCQDMKKNYESQENVTEHTRSSACRVKSVGHGSSGMEDARQSHVKEGHIKSFDNAIVAEVHTDDRYHENGANRISSRNNQAKKRGSLQERRGLEPVGSIASNPDKPSSSSVQRYPSTLSKDFHLVQNWIDSEREKLLRRKPWLSDSTELGWERMEILNKMDELRYLLESRPPTKVWNGIPSMEDGTRGSKSTISGSEYEHPQSPPSFSRHPSSVFESRTSFDDENRFLQRTQPPRASCYGGMHYSPHQFPHNTPCIHRNYRTFCPSCSRHSDSDALPYKLHPRGFQMENLHRRERDYDCKRHCRPILGAAHFLSCYACLKVLQIPEDFNFLSSRYKQLRCGACLEILKFSVNGSNQIVPRPSEARQFTEMSALGSSQRGWISYSAEEHSQSLDRSHSTEGEHAGYVSRDSGVSGRRRRSAGDQRPLHSLMGYFSATDIVYQERD